ncbi:MAG: hypothetical protein IKT78_04900 [Ruminiclostridium sp.]|nr:hypothetical protein [Ruminiclostridium sp.]
MKGFTGFAIGILAVVGAIAAVGIYLKKKTEKEQLEYEKFDEIMDSEEDFDAFFDEEDEIIDEADENDGVAEAIAEAAEEISE